MNLKDRLQQNISSTQQDSELINNYIDFSLDDIFDISIDAFNCIINYINNKKNIIFIYNKSFDKSIILNYMKSRLLTENKIIIEDIPESYSCNENHIFLIQNSDIDIIVKIFEQIMYGINSFIFCFNLRDYDNVLEKLKTAIALNYQNLTTSNINTLIGSSNSVFVQVSNKENGLISFSKIEEVNYYNQEISLKTIYQEEVIEKSITIEKTDETNKNEETDISDEPKEIENQNVSVVVENIQNNDEENNNDDIEIKSTDSDGNNEKEIKRNKYELLREKVRLKRLSNNNGK